MRNLFKLTLVLLACTMLVWGCGNGDKDKDKGKDKEQAKPKPSKPKPPPATTPGGAAATQAVKPPTSEPTPPTPPTPAGAEGPKAAMVALADAMAKGDVDAVMKCIEAAAETKAYLKELIPALSKISAFIRAGKKAYGEQAWKEELTKAGLDDMEVFPIPEEMSKTLKIEVQGEDKATATWKGAEKPFNLVKKGGAWLVVPPEDTVPPADKREEAKKMMKAMIAGVDAGMAKIGKPGVAAKDVIAAWTEAVQKATGGGATPPAPPTPPEE